MAPKLTFKVKRLRGGVLVGDFEIEARAGGRVRGSLVGLAGRDVVHVEGIWVDPDLRRQGVGTKLYEKAAAEACRRFKKPLGTDPNATLEPAAEAFWRKQVRKGRAIRIRIGDYRLRACPAPKSLSGYNR